MLKKDFWYDLPKELIAQEPAAPRDAARLMVLDRQNDSIVHSVFHDLPQFLEKGDLLRMGELMAESHASMRDDFEITVPQIDTLVDIVKATIGDKGGVRMTGGGFGGCVVALIPEDLVDTVQQAVANEYEAKTGIKETFYVCKPSQGAGQC